MNATDIIEQYKLLPENEQAKVAEFIESDAKAKVRYADNETALTAAKKIFEQQPDLFHRLAQ